MAWWIMRARDRSRTAAGKRMTESEARLPLPPFDPPQINWPTHLVYIVRYGGEQKNRWVRLPGIVVVGDRHGTVIREGMAGSEAPSPRPPLIALGFVG